LANTLSAAKKEDGKVGGSWAEKSLQVNCKPLRLRVFHYMSVVKLKINCLLKSLLGTCTARWVVFRGWWCGGAENGATHLHSRGHQSDEMWRSC